MLVRATERLFACLLDPENLAVIFSPLKQLQVVQVLEFEHYGIKTLAINEDTPNDPDLWKVRTDKNLLRSVGYVDE